MKSQNRIYTFPSYGPTSGHVADASKNRAWHYHIVGFLPVAALYLILGFYQIDDQSLWTDEVISVGRIAADKPMSTRLYSQAPLYFIILDLWTQAVGKTAFALRSLSVLLGLAAICLTYRLALSLFNRRTALFAAVLLATSPYLVWYAQEVRYVTLILVTSLAMMYSFHRAIASDVWKWWVSYAAASVLALFSFVTMVFLLVAHGVYVFSCASHRPMLRRWMICQLVALFVFSIWFGVRSGPKLIAAVTKAPTVVSHEQGRSREKLPAMDLVGAIPYTFFALSVGFSFGPSLEVLHESRSMGTLLSHASSLISSGFLFASLFVLGLVRLRQERDTDIFLLLWLSVPIVGTFTVASMTTYHVYNTRYVAMVLPAYILVLAAAIAGFRRSRIQIGMLVAVLLVNGLSLANYYFNPRYAREDTRSAARYLESAARPGQIILAVGNATALRYYYKGDLPIVRVDRQPTNNGSDVAENLQELVKNHHRLWLVEIRPWETDPKGNVKLTLDHLYRLIQHKTFAGVNIYEFNSDGIAFKRSVEQIVIHRTLEFRWGTQLFCSSFCCSEFPFVHQNDRISTSLRNFTRSILQQTITYQ